MKTTSPLARKKPTRTLPSASIAHHNDCFVSSADDYGTYDDTAVEKPYLAADTRYTMMGGETCNPSPPYSDCPHSIQELSRFHWTYLNWDYNVTLLNGWRNQGCFPDVEKKLGYRYRMLLAEVQDEARPGGEFRINLELINEGWSNPVNPRLAEIVIRETATGKEYTYSIDQDPRLWPLNDTIALDIRAGIPQNLAAGQYKIFFTMPDPEMSLYDNPYFSIRTANTGTWESESGFNSLLTEFEVTDNPALPAYGGTGFFYPRQPEIVEAAKIVIDGQAEDWNGITAVYSIPGQPAESIKAYNNGDSLYFVVQGAGMQSAFQLFIDADNDALTGYHAWQWQTNGSDYLVENGILYKYQGTSGEWNWAEIKNISLAENPENIEFGMALADLDQVALGGMFSIAFVNDPQNTVQACYLPEQNGYFISLSRLLANPQSIKAAIYGRNAIVYWPAPAESNIYTIIERSADGINFEKIASLRNDIIAYSDGSLSENSVYYYRAYRTNGMGVSAATEPIEITTGNESTFFLDMKLDGSMDDWTGLEPIATGYGQTLEALRMVNYSDSLYYSIEGVTVPEDIVVYMDTDREESTGLPDHNSHAGLRLQGQLRFALQSCWSELVIYYERSIGQRPATSLKAGST